MMFSERVRALHRSFAAFQRGDAERGLEIYSPDAVLDSGGIDGVFRGHEALLQGLAAYRTAFKKWKAEVTEMVELEDSVVVGLRERGIGGISGTPVEQVRYWRYDFDGDKVAKVTIYFDREEAVGAAGLGQRRNP